jgi:prenyltransferase beta subunit
MTAHLRMNAVYWGLTALCLMKHKDALDPEETIEYVMSCWDDEAGEHRSPITIPLLRSRSRLRPP